MAARVAHPESIVETEWVAQHLGDDNLRLVEVDVDTTAYDQGHIQGAVGWNWTTQLNDTVSRDILNREQMQRLLGESGIGRNTTLVLYGDNNNWFATYAFWQIKMLGHRRLKLMNGGRAKWEKEGRSLTTQTPSHPRRSYRASNPDTSIRATRDYVLEVASTRNNVGLVDVRAPRRIQRRVTGPGKPPPGGGPAWGPHTCRGQHPLGHCRQPGRRHLQVCGRAQGDLRRKGDHLKQGDHNLLPNW